MQGSASQRNSEEGELVLNSTHGLVIFPSASSLKKIYSQDGRASNSKQGSRHLLCSAVGMMIVIYSMYR